MTGKGCEVKIRKIKSDNVTRVRSQYSKTTKIARVYADEARPSETGGSVVDDLMWRRTHEQPTRNEIIAGFIAEELDKQGIEFKTIKAKYNRFCGCSMCPCSPGYDIIITKGEGQRFPSFKIFDIWIEL